MNALRLPEFFDSPLCDVNPLFPLMILYYPDKRVPEWLRGICRYEDLPRVDRDIPMQYKFSVAFIRDRDIAIRIRWAIEVFDGPWRLDDNGIHYHLRTDALQHKMRWSDEMSVEGIGAL